HWSGQHTAQPDPVLQAGKPVAPPTHNRKIIRALPCTRCSKARFEAERQALALMGHPNIAKAFDAGTTHTGRPYFVMELVNFPQSRITKTHFDSSPRPGKSWLPGQKQGRRQKQPRQRKTSGKPSRPSP